MGRIPKKQLDAADTAKDSHTYTAEIAEGDLVIMFTDGFSDNIHDHELLKIVDKALPPAHADRVGRLTKSSPPATIAKALALAAQEKSVDTTANVPFTAMARSYGVDAQLDTSEAATEVPREECPSQQRHTPELARTLFESKRRTRDGVLAGDTSKRGPLLFPLSSSKAV